MEAFRIFFQQLIPFAIVLVLLVFAAVLFHTIKILIEVRKSVEDINTKLSMLEEPVSVVNKFSHTLGAFHDKGGKAVSRAVGSTSSNISLLRNGLSMLLKRSKKKRQK
ncbi:MAG: hypothetical protein GX778_02880 [Erysipelothrix sp.]|nr:hypothetical protein [Erysipelothrix sp.]